MSYKKKGQIYKEKKLDWLSKRRHVISDINYKVDPLQKFEIYNIERTGIGMFWLQDLFNNRDEFFSHEDDRSSINTAKSFIQNPERLERDYYNILSQEYLIDAIKDNIQKYTGTVYLSAKYITTNDYNEPRSMIMLCKVINDTVIVKDTILTEQGWIYRLDLILDKETDKYERAPFIHLFLWTMEQIKNEHPYVKYGAIQAVSKGSQTLMKKLEKYGYSEVFDYTPDLVEEKPFILPEHPYDIQDTKRKRVESFVFEFCHMCINPPLYTCGEIKCCSRECAEKHYK